ncbi:hypothetical protein ACIBQX_31275 [Nonomuraea sp. NPDC049714]|uniref:hypothetical protein n=1 Tax=Nonomuraea sp. NPDC049714 TaxID=3364357 RepID=UPI00378DCB89
MGVCDDRVVGLFRVVGVSVTVTVVVLVGVGVGVVAVGVGVVGVGVGVGVEVEVDVGVPVPTTRFTEGPPDAGGVQLYHTALFTFSANPLAFTATVPVAVGLTTTFMVGIDMGEPLGTAVCGVKVATAVTGVLGTGLPLGVTVPSATTVLLGVISAVAFNWLAVLVGCRMSQVIVTVALATGVATGALSSIWKGMFVAVPPVGVHE